MDVHIKRNECVFPPVLFFHNALCVIYHTYHLNIPSRVRYTVQHRESGPGVKVFVYGRNGMPYCARRDSTAQGFSTYCARPTSAVKLVGR